MKKKFGILIIIIIIELVIFFTMTMVEKHKQNNSKEVVANQEIESEVQEGIDQELVIEKIKMEIQQAKLESEQHEQELKIKREEILRKRKALYEKEEKRNQINASVTTTETDGNNSTDNSATNIINNNVYTNSSDNTANDNTNEDEINYTTVKISEIIHGTMENLNYTEKVEDLGIPLIKKYPNNTKEHISSRNVWDMQLYNNRIYIGSGDYNYNTGPVDVYYYDLTKKEFVKEATLPDEQINRFLIIDNELIITGTDPKEGWEYGNYFVWNNDSWVKKRTLLGAIHNFDLVKFNGKLFAGIGNDSDSSIVMSTDGGETFSYVYMYEEENKKLEIDSSTSNRYRVYDLVEYKNKLYAFCNYKIYEYREEENIFMRITDHYIDYGYAIGLGEYVPLKTKLVYDNKLFYINGFIKYTEDLKNYTTVKFDKSSTSIYDALIIEGELYTLGSTLLPNNEYLISVYKSKDCENWELVMYFYYKDYTRSFEYADGAFYFGIGASTNPNKDGGNVGRILKVNIK